LLSKGGSVSQPVAAVTVSAPAEKKEFKPFKVGSKGEAVKKVQELLSLNADGDFGPGTEKAVKAFQKKSGLPVTGVVDQATLKALRGK
jgi:peptidoglycan hydrolase-like protein with peptidoglycan-binding domain